MSADRHPAFFPVIFAGGLLFGIGLAVSEMAKPEVVLSFLQLEDLGLVFVMGSGTIVMGVSFILADRYATVAPLTGTAYTRRLKALDRNVLFGGVLFGIGWGVSGICPGAGYASLGIGNYPILWAIGGMFLGAYLQGYWRSR